MKRFVVVVLFAACGGDSGAPADGVDVDASVSEVAAEVTAEVTGEVAGEDGASVTEVAGEVVTGACDEDGTPFGGGTGTEADPFLVCARAQLDAIRGAGSAHWLMTRDIDLSAAPWAAYPFFVGTLDGGGHTLTGLRSTSVLGGFAGTSDGTIQHLTFDDLQVTSSESVAGVIGQSNSESAKLIDVHVTRGKVTSTGPVGVVHTAAGVALRWNASASDVSFEGEVIVEGATGASSISAGLVFGVLNGSATNIHAVGTLTNSDGDEIGGLVGTIGSGALEDCSADITLTTGGEIAGGLVGLMQPGAALRRCHVTGSVLGSGSATQLGGAVGLAYGMMHNGAAVSAELTELAVEVTVGGSHTIGGIAGKLAGAKLSNSWFEGQVDTAGGIGGCLVASFERAGNPQGFPGTIDFAWADCALTRSNPNATAPIGGVTGDQSAAPDVHLVWNSERASASGFTGTSANLRGLTALEMKNPASWAGWSSPWVVRAGDYPRLP